MKLEIKDGCAGGMWKNGCPFCHTDAETGEYFWRCAAVRDPEGGGGGKNIAVNLKGFPDWCPLLQSPMEVRRQNGDWA